MLPVHIVNVLLLALLLPWQPSAPSYSLPTSSSTLAHTGWLAAVLPLDNKLLPAWMRKGGRHEARLVLEGKPYLHPVTFANKGERT